MLMDKHVAIDEAVQIGDLFLVPIALKEPRNPGWSIYFTAR
jgi:hypothetical protein